MTSYKQPYPWFGGKAKIMPAVWERFGDVPNAIDPFFGGGAFLLFRPEAGRIANGTNPQIRIALCGYEGEHNDLEDLGWDKIEWRAHGGYSTQSGSKNRERERVWFSPACLPARKAGLFEKG